MNPELRLFCQTTVFHALIQYTFSMTDDMTYSLINIINYVLRGVCLSQQSYNVHNVNPNPNYYSYSIYLLPIPYIEPKPNSNFKHFYPLI